MIRAVLDANVLVSGLPAASGTLSNLIDQWRAGRLRLVVSQHIIDEVSRAWNKPYWRVRYSPTQVDRALALLQQEAEVVPITVQVTGIATHPEDDLVLATAVSAQVDYLATGDKRLQDLSSYQGLRIVPPGQLLALLEQEAAGATSDR